MPLVVAAVEGAVIVGATLAVENEGATDAGGASSVVGGGGVAVDGNDIEGVGPAANDGGSEGRSKPLEAVEEGGAGAV
jgi:hypothetical protein